MPLLLILFSYILILSTSLNMPRPKNSHKEFSTCSSHLTWQIPWPALHSGDPKPESPHL
ncbi:Olfactory receptor 13C8, partial [Ophiophagus hannah]